MILGCSGGIRFLQEVVFSAGGLGDPVQLRKRLFFQQAPPGVRQRCAGELLEIVELRKEHLSQLNF